MDLRTYLFINHMCASDFAKKIGLSRSYFNQVKLGNCIPSRRLAQDIERLTEGQVTASELLKKRQEAI